MLLMNDLISIFSNNEFTTTITLIYDNDNDNDI